MLRRLTLSLLHAHPAKLSIAKKRFAAALDPSFLEEILRGDGILEKAVTRRPCVGTLPTHSLVNYAMEGGARGLPIKYVHVFLDEWSGQGPGNCFRRREGRVFRLGRSLIA